MQAGLNLVHLQVGLKSPHSPPDWFGVVTFSGTFPSDRPPSDTTSTALDTLFRQTVVTDRQELTAGTVLASRLCWCHGPCWQGRL